MSRITALFRRLFIWRAPRPTPRYSAAQVMAVLRGETIADRAAIDRQIAMLPVLLGDESVLRRYRHFPRYVEVLPRILSEYQRGVDPVDIVDRLDFLATEYGVRTVVEITAQLLAERLNEPTPRAGLPVAN